MSLNIQKHELTFILFHHKTYNRINHLLIIIGQIYFFQVLTNIKVIQEHYIKDFSENSLKFIGCKNTGLKLLIYNAKFLFT